MNCCFCLSLMSTLGPFPLLVSTAAVHIANAKAQHRTMLKGERGSELSGEKAGSNAVKGGLERMNKILAGAMRQAKMDAGTPRAASTQSLLKAMLNQTGETLLFSGFHDGWPDGGDGYHYTAAGSWKYGHLRPIWWKAIFDKVLPPLCPLYPQYSLGAITSVSAVPPCARFASCARCPCRIHCAAVPR